MNQTGKDQIEPLASTSKSNLVAETFGSQNDEQSKAIDPNCIVTIKNRLVRIQYPGIVKNVDKALETLGGLPGIERAVSQKPNKLQLNLHPGNKYNKGCVADCDSNTGLLIKVKVEKSNKRPPKYSYEIIGATIRNFVFNKLIDFQYLPLVANYPEKSSSDLKYIYESILPKKVPTIEEMMSDEKVNMPLFLPPVGFSRAEGQRKLPIDKKTNDNVNPEFIFPKKKKHISAFIKPEQASVFHKFTDPTIPTRPTDMVTTLMNKKNYDDHLQKLQELFATRPVWTKNGVLYNTNISKDLIKILLPVVAYYVITGPWRGTWIRFGYDPRKDPEARKYQNLDYRMPHPIRSNLKIGSKRCLMTKTGPTSLKRLSKEQQSNVKNSSQESIFILRPNMLPPARQMFYQYCDILLPEIQTMLARLPPVPSHTKCDAKNGWLPTSFSEQCREVVNKYVDQQASNELTQHDQNQQEQQSSKVSDTKSTDYCSLMIRNVKRGVYKETNPLNFKFETEPSTSYDISETDSVTEIIVNSDSEETLYDDTFYQECDDEPAFVDTDGFTILNADQMDIDIEALEDVKNIIANTQS